MTNISADTYDLLSGLVLAAQAIECWVVVIHPQRGLPLLIGLGGPESEATTIQVGDETLRLELRQPGPTSYVAGGINGSEPRRLLFGCDYRGNFKIHVHRRIQNLEAILNGGLLTVDPSTDL